MIGIKEKKFSQLKAYPKVQRYVLTWKVHKTIA